VLIYILHITKTTLCLVVPAYAYITYFGFFGSLNNSLVGSVKPWIQNVKWQNQCAY